MKKQEGCNPVSNENTCTNCPVRELSLFTGLSPEELAFLNKNRGIRTYQSGEIIFEEGEPSKGLLALNSGKVKITKSGLFKTSTIVSLKKPVDFLGLEALVLEENYTSSAIALEVSTICFIDKNHFLEVIKGNVELALRIIRLLAEESEAADERMLILTQKHMRGRLADALLLLHERFGSKPDSGILNVELKRADLAAMSNMTPANAIRVLSRFSQESLIEINKRKIKIIDIEKLKNVSRIG